MTPEQTAQLAEKRLQPPVRTPPPSFAPTWFAEISDEIRIDWIAKGLLESTAFSLVYGEPGSGKSFLATDLALHIALGRPWFGRKTTQRPVLYVAAEGGTGFRRRLKAFQQHHGLEDANVPFGFIPVAPNMLEGEHVDALASEIAAARDRWEQPVGLVVIDTLARSMPGANESAPDDMGLFVAACDRIRRETGAHVLVVHHKPKSGSPTPRGHGCLLAATDTTLDVQKGANGATSTATVDRQKEGADGIKVAFGLKVVEIGIDDDGDQITSCVIEAIEDATEADQKALPDGPQSALDALIAVVDAAQIAESQDAIKFRPAGHSAHVRVGVWRDEFYARQIDKADIKPDTLLKRFKRSADYLKKRGKVGFRDDQAWLITE